MKKNWLLFAFLLFFLIKCYPQQNSIYFIEVNTNYAYYFFNNSKYSTDLKNSFNYGFSVLINKQISRTLKVSSGITYVTKNFYYNVVPTSFNDYFMGKKYLLSYINVPITLSYLLTPRDNLLCYISNSLIMNNIVNYDLTRYYSYAEKNDFNIDEGQKPGWSYRLGFEIKKTFSSKLFFNFCPYIDYKFILDFDEQPLSYKNLKDDRLSCGFSIGLIYYIQN